MQPLYTILWFGVEIMLVDKLHARRDSNQTLVYSVVSPELATSGALPIMLLTYANFNPLEFNLRNEKLHYTKGRKI